MSWPDLGELQDRLAVDHQDLGRGQAGGGGGGGQRGQRSGGKQDKR